MSPGSVEQTLEERVARLAHEIEELHDVARLTPDHIAPYTYEITQIANYATGIILYVEER